MLKRIIGQKLGIPPNLLLWLAKRTYNTAGIPLEDPHQAAAPIKPQDLQAPPKTPEVLDTHPTKPQDPLLKEEPPQHSKHRRYSPVFADETTRELQEQIVRVDQAGEFGAQRIYDGQLAVLRHSAYGSKIQEMRNQEQKHLDTFNRLIRERRVRPTILNPLWNVAGYALGYGTALIGKEAAMACTVAVEEVISEHYNEQLREILVKDPNDTELREIIKQYRDDEMEHHDIALEYNAKKAPFYDLLYSSIKTGTKVAIWLSTRI